MIRGIDLTLRVVAKSKNHAAAGLLESAFQSTSKAVRKLAGPILVTRQSGEGLDSVIRNFDPTDPDHITLVKENRAALIPRLRGAVVDPDISLAQRAFRLAYTQKFYEVLPTLATYCLGPGAQDGNALSLNIDFLKFLTKYTDALTKKDSSDYQLLYTHLLPELAKILVKKVKDYPLTQSELTLTVYLWLYPFFTETGVDRDMYVQLRLSSSPVCVAAYRRLLKETTPCYFLLVTRCLDRLNPPPIISQTVAERGDFPFLEMLFKSMKKPLSTELKTNLTNLPSLTWIGQIDSFLDQLDTEAQCGLVLMLQNVKQKDGELKSILLNIFGTGKGEGRTAALSALANFSGTDINRLVWDASGDDDPSVQVEALTQLYNRKIPHALSRIAQFAESPHEMVRNAIQKLLPDFRFNQFMQSFDKLDEESRRQMFSIVRLLDKQTTGELSKMLMDNTPVVRAKALMCIDSGRSIVPLLEDTLCEVLVHDKMSQLRCKAAELLVDGRRNESRVTLVQAFHRDESPEVRTAAKTSLENRPTNW
ncbi:MAG: hypothetical protein LBI05_10230 [Planctomycetaceae bacterium]|jgi:hypothetical protein|nr:hypothetical protein [Planctomycetaceae bacterium]